MVLQHAPKPIVKVIATLLLALASTGLSLFLPVVVSPELSQMAFADIDTTAANVLWANVSRETIEGESVTVCSDTHRNAAQDAVQMWNSGLRDKGFVEFDVFTFADTCPSVAAESTVSVDHILVRGLPETDPDFRCPTYSDGTGATGCALLVAQRGVQNNFVGILELRLNTDKRPVAHENPSHPGYTVAGFEANRRTVAHELGHALGMDHPSAAARPGRAARARSR